MMLSLDVLQERIAQQFPDVQQVDQLTLRFTKRWNDIPYAAFYLDLNEQLPTTEQMLNEYQDRVLGGHYFKERTSVQWSTYLYFIVRPDVLALEEGRQARELIERDRTYARKFVVPEGEVERILSAPVIVPGESRPPQAGILSLWTQSLVEAGLDRAILSERTLRDRMKLIENPAESSPRKAEAPREDARAQVGNFIRSLQLNEYREYPAQRFFEFGTANLIFGRNGSGKTSLLEAIELFYCGRNKRSNRRPSSFELVAGLSDGQTEKATEREPLQTYRNRNLTWYGQPEVKTHNLHVSFAQYNFLDTDAAVTLGEATSRLEEDLSKLLVGSKTSTVWHTMQRVGDEISTKRKALRELEAQATEELAVLQARLQESAAVPRESQAIEARLREMVVRLGWKLPDDIRESLGGDFLEPLSEMLSIAAESASVDWIEAPVTYGRLTEYCREARRAIKKAEGDVSRLESMLADEQRLEGGARDRRAALDLATRLRRLAEAELPSRIREQADLEQEIARLATSLAGLDTDAVSQSFELELADTPLAEFVQRAVERRASLQSALDATKGEYARFSDLRERSLNLAQQLRELARQILSESASDAECPLCHTAFPQGELARQMNRASADPSEELGRALLARLQDQQSSFDKAATQERLAGRLSEYSSSAGLGPGVPFSVVLKAVKDAARSLAESRLRLSQVEEELSNLHRQGLNSDVLEDVASRLASLGHAPDDVSVSAMDEMIYSIETGSLAASEALEDARQKSQTVLQKTAVALGAEEASVEHLRQALSRLKEHLAVTEVLRRKLGEFTSAFPWPQDKPIAELGVECEAVRRIGADLRFAIERERNAQAVEAQSVQRVESLNERLEDIRTRSKRFQKAGSVIERLRREHSLQEAMETALQQNRASIERIFSAIHSPAEFRGLGSDLATLVREADGREATLSEISTGQRAALALSLFLAQNAQLSSAPPVIIIDDPIAHVDDLNCLSFLDYLREVLLTGRRQLFFSTASEKLAGLFQRKFDFLGEGFHRIDLVRDDA